MTTKNFCKQVKVITKDYFYAEKIKIMVIEEWKQRQIAAIYALRKHEEDEIYFSVFYAYNTMHNVSKVGHFVINDQSNGDAYLKANIVLKEFII